MKPISFLFLYDSKSHFSKLLGVYPPPSKVLAASKIIFSPLVPIPSGYQFLRAEEEELSLTGAGWEALALALAQTSIFPGWDDGG